MTVGSPPTLGHPITITAHPRPVTVHAGGQVIAHSERALELRESTYRPVFYIPRADVEMALLTPSDRHTHCPYKGDASYYSIILGDELRKDAVWSYEAPFEWMEAITGYLAFYPDRVDSIEG